MRIRILGKDQTFFGPWHVVCKVVMVEVLPQVLQPVQQVTRLPHKILQSLHV
jgi:hypothetical protein